MTGGEFLADFPGDDAYPNQSCQRTQPSRQNGVKMNGGASVDDGHSGCGRRSGHSPTRPHPSARRRRPNAEFIKEMHSGHVGEIGGLAGTEPACVKQLHRHRHACFARKLAFGNVQGTEKRFGLWDAQSLHGWSVWRPKGGDWHLSSVVSGPASPMAR